MSNDDTEYQGGNEDRIVEAIAIVSGLIGRLESSDSKEFAAPIILNLTKVLDVLRTTVRCELAMAKLAKKNAEYGTAIGGSPQTYAVRHSVAREVIRNSLDAEMVMEGIVEHTVGHLLKEMLSGALMSVGGFTINMQPTKRTLEVSYEIGLYKPPEPGTSMTKLMSAPQLLTEMKRLLKLS